MFDIWAFLVQTLTVSGVAVLLLIIKRLFRDKLPPKWHFLVWSSLGIMILLPAGLNGRYTLFRWQLLIELIKAQFGDYSYTRVLFPVPFLNAVPKTFLDWVFVIYTAGVVFFAVKYIVSYIKLRHILGNGSALHGEELDRIEQIASEHGIKLCKVIEVSGLPSAFVCGVIRPVLAVPANDSLDDKIILHELFHLKNKDTFWSVVICLLRCIHWCNPLLIYCANRAINDMESRCDQYVLECLEGEERRTYGHILLSMTNEQFANIPASTSINNGGKNIRDRIEAIARFKKYPAGMGLVSVCVIISLTISLVIGVQSNKVFGAEMPVQIALASARSTPCTTYAAAFDTYAKAVLTHNAVYRAMCAPAEMQTDIARKNVHWEYYIDAWPETDSGYCIYNLKHPEENVYEGLLAVEIRNSSDGETEERGEMCLAVQNLRAEKENGRWTVVALDDFYSFKTTKQKLEWGFSELPGFIYSATASDIRVDIKVQTVHYIDNSVETETDFIFGNTYFDTVPKPNAVFTTAQRMQFSSCTYLGTESERNSLKQLGLSVLPIFNGEERPEELLKPVGTDSVGSSSTGEDRYSQTLEAGWGPTIDLGGGGGSIDPVRETAMPEFYAADLYLNNELAAQLDLYPREEVTP